MATLGGVVSLETVLVAEVVELPAASEIMAVKASAPSLSPVVSMVPEKLVPSQLMPVGEVALEALIWIVTVCPAALQLPVMAKVALSVTAVIELELAGVVKRIVGATVSLVTELAAAVPVFPAGSSSSAVNVSVVSP